MSPAARRELAAARKALEAEAPKGAPTDPFAAKQDKAAPKHRR